MRTTIALLSEDVSGTDVAEVAVQSDLIADDLNEQKNMSMRIEQNSSVIEEAELDSKTVDAMTELVEGAEDGIDPIAAEAIKIAVEAIQVRCGHKVGTKVAVESFYKSPTKKASSLALAQEMRQVQAKIDKQVSIAQEGMWDDIKTSISRKYVTIPKMKDRMVKAGLAFDHAGASEQVITYEAWMNYINIDGDQQLSGKAALATLARVTKIIENDGLSDILIKATGYLSQVKTSVKDCWFFSNQEEVDKIKEVTENSRDLVQQLREIVGNTNRKSNKEATALPLTEEEKGKIQEQATTLFFGNKLQQPAKAFVSEMSKTNYTILINSKFFRVAGAVRLIAGQAVADKFNIHGDIVEAKKAVACLHEIANHINSAFVLIYDICFGAIKYIEASTANMEDVKN